MTHRDAHAVGIRVGGKQQVRALALRKLDAQLQGLANLGVGIGAGREVAVRLGLLGHERHVGAAALREHAGHELAPRAVERRVDQLEAGEVLPRGSHERGGHVAVERVLADPGGGAGGYRVVKRRGANVCERVHRVDGRLNLAGHLGRDLAAVGPVDLVAVVLLGVVRRRDDDARVATQVAHGKGERRRGLKARVEIGVDTVGSEYRSRTLRELGAAMAQVMPDDDRGRVAFGRVGEQPGGKALRRLADAVDVHAVGTQAEGSSQATRTKGKVSVEGIGELVGSIGELLKSGPVSLPHNREPVVIRHLDVVLHLYSPVKVQVRIDDRTRRGLAISEEIKGELTAKRPYSPIASRKAADMRGSAAARQALLAIQPAGVPAS